MTERVKAVYNYLKSKAVGCEIKCDLTGIQDGIISVSGSNLEIDIGLDYYNIVIISVGGYSYPFTGDNLIELFCALERLGGG